MQENHLQKNQEYLKLLAIFHYILAVIAIAFSSFFIFHLIFGIFALVAPEAMMDSNGNAPPSFFGWIFALVGAGAILFGWSYAICLLCAGRFLARRKHYLFCLVIAGLSCLFMPLGTVLGVFTIIVLNRPSVKELFAQDEQ